MTESGITQFRVDAERVLLGRLMGTPQLAETCGVAPSDLCDTFGHPEILGAIITSFEQRRSADPVLVLDELIKRDQASRIGHGPVRSAAYLAELLECSRTAGSIGHHAQIVREATARRRIHAIGTELTRAAASQGDLDVVLDYATQQSVALSLLVDTPLDGDAPIAGLSTIADFVRERDNEHTWVIPGIIEHQDRVMIVAGEGVGKSVLGRMLCTLLAAGRHPFAPNQKITPRRTLLVDLENPPDLLRRGLRGQVQMIYDDNLDIEDRGWVWRRPGGLNIRAAADRNLLARVIEMANPDLVAIGPLYKASLPKANDTYEIAAQETARVIDQFRERYGCAFWIEHHAPKADAAGHRGGPIGSSYWLRWPEFGLLLRPDAEAQGDQRGNVFKLERFRGDRDERCWPDKLIKRAGKWPWTPDWDDAEVRQRLFDAIDEEKSDSLRLERERAEFDRKQLAGSGTQYSSPVEERYWPEKDDEPVSGVSNDSSQVVHNRHQVAAPAQTPPGPVPEDPPDPPEGAEGDSEPYDEVDQYGWRFHDDDPPF